MGKASNLKALWQFSFFILPFVIIGIMALPTMKMAHQVEMKFFFISLVFIAVIIKSEVDKRRYRSLTVFFNHVQSIMLAIMSMVILFGLLFLFDYQFEKWFGIDKIYGSLILGFLYVIVCFTIIFRNPQSVHYVPWILIFPFLVSTLFEGFSTEVVALWCVVAVAAGFGYYSGIKRSNKKYQRFN